MFWPKRIRRFAKSNTDDDSSTFVKVSDNLLVCTLGIAQRGDHIEATANPIAASPKTA